MIPTLGCWSAREVGSGPERPDAGKTPGPNDAGTPVSTCEIVPPGTGARALLDSPDKFCPDTHGSGIFGRWGIDARGLPEYRYTMDQLSDPRARYFNSEGDNRTDHWHMIGNHRIIAMAHNGGYVELFNTDRGAKLMNWHDPKNGTPMVDFPVMNSNQHAAVPATLDSSGHLSFPATCAAGTGCTVEVR